MIFVLRGLFATALIAASVSPAYPTVTGRSHPTSKPRKPAKAITTDQAADPSIMPSDAVARVVEWVSSSGDNHALPWAVVDKRNASMFLFDAQGKELDAVPVLIGVAAGDLASPGVGSKKLADLGPAEKTTPAGRFLAKFGLPVQGQRVLWVDYATSVALHPIPTDINPKEKRRERMLSPTSADNRITFGCINVPKVFYGSKLSPLFRKKGGYVYVLPDTKRLEDVFPRLWVQQTSGEPAVDTQQSPL